jgi:hypothetical protein
MVLFVSVRAESLSFEKRGRAISMKNCDFVFGGKEFKTSQPLRLNLGSGIFGL